MKVSIPALAPKSAVVCLLFVLAAILGVGLGLRISAARASILSTWQPIRPEHDPRLHVAARERVTGSETTRRKYPLQPLSLDVPGGRAVLAYPPAAPSMTAATVVYLHGIHGKPANGCPWFREGATTLGWLVCPEANGALGNGTFSWAGGVAEQRAVVARAEDAARRMGADPEAPGVLVGFSQGVWVALDLVRAHLGHYRGLVLLGGDAEPRVSDLTGAGITRIALGAGKRDATFTPMKRTAARLEREGMDVRFVDLGDVGHTYMTEAPEALRDAIAWAGSASHQ